jgi:hypothetical protein
MFLADWFRPSVKIGFDDVVHAIRNPTTFIIINTLPSSEQECLIQNTVSVDKEEETINGLLTQYDNIVRKIIVYGKNSIDPSVEKKYKQLIGLGIGDVYIYSGGLFEWMLLQDVYGVVNFPTTKPTLDILRYKPSLVLSPNPSST